MATLVFCAQVIPTVFKMYYFSHHGKSSSYDFLPQCVQTCFICYFSILILILFIRKYQVLIQVSLTLTEASIKVLQSMLDLLIGDYYDNFVHK